MEPFPSTGSRDRQPEAALGLRGRVAVRLSLLGPLRFEYFMLLSRQLLVWEYSQGDGVPLGEGGCVCCGRGLGEARPGSAARHTRPVSTSRVQRLPPHSCRRTQGLTGLFMGRGRSGGWQRPVSLLEVGRRARSPASCRPHFTTPPGPGLSLPERTARSRSARPLPSLRPCLPQV